jgi:hypothetical protein
MGGGSSSMVLFMNVADVKYTWVVPAVVFA